MENEMGVYTGIDLGNKKPIVIGRRPKTKENFLVLGTIGDGHGFSLKQSFVKLEKMEAAEKIHKIKI